MHRLGQVLARARRAKTMAALLFVDLDDFKPINDTLGHKAGDEVLRQIAKRLTSRLREIDTVARIGGDEFTVVLADVAEKEAVSKMAKKLIGALSEPFSIDGKKVSLGASIGVALYPRHAETPEDLLIQADNAMYAAKENGKGQFIFAPPRKSPPDS